MGAQVTVPRQGPSAVPAGLSVVDWGAAYNLSDEDFAVLCFDAGPQSPSHTRRFLHRTLTRWSLLHVLDDADAVTAELVANAIRHALPPYETAAGGTPTAWIALVHRERSLICAVSDPSQAPPVPVDRHSVGEFTESGRGLQIVAELSDSWGHSPPSAAGKTVWARIAVTAG